MSKEELAEHPLLLIN